MIKSLAIVVCFLALFSVSISAQNDPNCVVRVIDNWYGMGTRLFGFGPFFIYGSRETAIISLAAHDALNTIDPQYEYYLGPIDVLSRGRTKHANECASVLAAYRITALNHTQERLKSNSDQKLTTPEQTQSFVDTIEAFYNQEISTLRNSNNVAHRIDDGIAIGEASARRILEARWNDGWKAISTPVFNPAPAIGKWYRQGTGPMTYQQWADVKMFVLSGPNEFMSPPPRALDDPSYIADLAQTKYIGGKTSQAAGNRTQAQSDAARWWEGGGNYHTVGVFRELAIRLSYDEHKTLAAFNIISVAQADQRIANSWQKNYHNYWRPFQAIQNKPAFDYTNQQGLQDLQDGNWLPWLATPNNQEYPAGHPMNTGSAANAMKVFMGFNTFPGGAITVGYDNSPNAAVVPQTFISWDDVMEQGIWARIFGGMHLEASCRMGSAISVPIGTKIANKFKRLDD